jgi:hypothetical protein
LPFRCAAEANPATRSYFRSSHLPYPERLQSGSPPICARPSPGRLVSDDSAHSAARLLEDRVSFKHRFRKILLCLFLGMGVLVGMSMRPEEIEELMHDMNRQEIVCMIPSESENGDDPIKKLLDGRRA